MFPNRTGVETHSALQREITPSPREHHDWGGGRQCFSLGGGEAQLCPHSLLEFLVLSTLKGEKTRLLAATSCKKVAILKVRGHLLSV